MVDWCRAEDSDLIATYSDPGVSGTLALHERPGRAAALELVKEHERDPNRQPARPIAECGLSLGPHRKIWWSD